jgi:hypothetical protein
MDIGLIRISNTLEQLEPYFVVLLLCASAHKAMQAVAVVVSVIKSRKY